MSYQVLARKWRPKNFQELRGQEHVSRALVNAIESGRLHHAYLFTGTRGVGKTTIARILSKCLNCEASGVTATPCGECGSCSEIDQGRFVDLIEVDAASRTKVDDTRELLENVQYRPTRGRYKVYLIDEVHMLSNSSFNALLKTLEEPPEHVIFLLATTDPQKLPVTVLSRCLQFHLKHMDEETIASHLQFILEQESVDFEATSLQLIAQSAEGSMRDALSLLDQAIAYGQGKVLEEDIRTMLGTIDHKFMVRLLEALASRDTVMAIKAIDEMSNYPVDFADALKELLSRLHQIAVYQATEVLLDSAASYVTEFAQIFEASDLQMYYQLGLHARRDMEWAPTAKQGLEMALLRMLAFQIDASEQAEGSSGPKKKVSLEPGCSTSSESTSSESTSSEEKPTAQEPDQLTPTSESSAQENQSFGSENLRKTEVKQKVKEISSEVSQATDLPEKPDSPEKSDEYADYAQYLQQDDEADHDEQALAFETKGESKAEFKEKVSEKTQSREEPAQEEQVHKEQGQNDDALASLHSALGLSFGEADKAESNEIGSKEIRSAEQPPEEALSDKTISNQVAPNKSALENASKDEGAKGFNRGDRQDTSEEAYDSDIERLMKSKSEYDATAQSDDVRHNEATNGNATASVTEESDEEFESIPELDAPKESMEWADLVKKLELDGTYHQIAQSSCAVWQSDQELTLELAPDQEVLLTDGAKLNVKNALESYLGKDLKVNWELIEPSVITPSQIWQHQAKLKLQKACNDLNQHPFSKQLQQQFGAKVDRQSVTYLNE